MPADRFPPCRSPLPRRRVGFTAGQASSATPRWLAVVMLLLTATQSGCMTGFGEYFRNGFKVGPNYKTPAAPISEHWIDYEDSRVRSEPPTDWAWWRVFNDATLDRLVQTSYAQNLTLREAGFRVMEARAIRAIAVGEMFPQMQQAFGSYTRQQRSMQALNGFGGGPGAAAVIPRNFDVYTLGGQLAWELDFWGRFRRAVESADASLDASIENFDDVLVILISDVAATYVEIRTLEQRIRYARSNTKYQQLSLDLAEARKAEGVASRLDIAQGITNVKQTESTIPQFEAQLRRAENRLCVLMGIPPQGLKELLAHPNHIPVAPPEVAVGVPAELIRRRPDVRRAEREVAAQSARIGIAESDLYPAFTINGSIFLQANRFQDLFKSSAVGGNVGPGFNWNILNYGRLVNAVRLEEARFMQEVAQYQSVVLNANREAEDALNTFLLAQQQTKILREGVAASIESRNLVNELYKGGSADFNRVFVAEAALVTQQDSLAQAEGAIAQALVQLYRSLGGGWQIRLQPLAAEGEMVVPAEALPPAPTGPPAAEPALVLPLPEVGP